MMLNPELKRHLWLELSTHRLIGMPAILGLVFLLAYLSEPTSLPWVSLAAFVAITVMWGAHLTSESILEEFRQGTWDAQRRSTLKPWDQTWGRMLGAPIFAWYGGVICLGTFVVAATTVEFPHPSLPFLATALGLAVFAHGLGAISALATTRVGRQTRSPVLLAFVFLMLISLAGPQLSLLMSDGSVHWFGIAFSRLWFVVLSVLMFSVWSFVGAWRMMAREMQERALPTAWLAFAVWLTIYLSGALLGELDRFSAIIVYSAVAFVVSVSMSVSVVWFENRDYVSWRRMMLYWSRHDFRRFFQEFPCWLSTLAFALMAALVLAANGGDLVGFGSFGGGEWALALVLWLFVVRDIALLHFFSLAKKSGKAVMVTIVYLILLYMILPSLFLSLELESFAKVLLPNPIEQPIVALGAAVLNAGVGLGLVAWRWRERENEEMHS